MVYEPKEWGVYEWDPELPIAENVAAAKTANALIEAEDLQKIEDELLRLGTANDSLSNTLSGVVDNVSTIDTSLTDTKTTLLQVESDTTTNTNNINSIYEVLPMSYDQNGIKIITLTQTQYDSITEKDALTLYIITE